MTDNEIIKALECLTGELKLCKDCSYNNTERYPLCRECCAKDALDIIKRQEKLIDELIQKFELLWRDERTIKSEAIKNFVDKLKAEYSTPDIFMPFNWISCEEMVLDEIAKEMVGGEE